MAAEANRPAPSSTPRARALGEQYVDLGRAWSELAGAALPDDVAAMREAKELLARRSELMHSDGAAAVDEVGRTWQRLDELAKEAETKFPLSDGAASDLRADLKRRVLALYDGEVRAHEALTKALGG